MSIVRNLLQWSFWFFCQSHYCPYPKILKTRLPSLWPSNVIELTQLQGFPEFFLNFENSCFNSREWFWKQSLYKKDVSLEIFFKKILWHRCFPVNSAKVPRTPILENTSRWLLLYFWASASVNNFLSCLNVLLLCNILHEKEMLLNNDLTLVFWSNAISPSKL